MYKNLSTAVKRTPQEFLLVLEEANQVALEKKEKKKRRIGKSKAEKELQEDIDKEVEALNEISHKEENK